MEPFTTLTAVAAPLLRENIDTDAIIPSREMRSVMGTGLDEGLFAGWRYTAIGSREPDPEFVLNQPRYAGARILVTGANVGCGSSREHAVWALAQFGFRVVIAPSFNPIFRNNCIANGLVPAALPEDVVRAIGEALENAETPVITVDLASQQVSLPQGRSWNFEIRPDARESLLNGLDPIDQTLLLKPAIEGFRADDRQRRSWVYSSVDR